jgi:hypothetical protein
VKAVGGLTLDGPDCAVVLMSREELFVAVYTLTVFYDLVVCKPGQAQKHAKSALSLIQGN